MQISYNLKKVLLWQLKFSALQIPIARAKEYVVRMLFVVLYIHEMYPKMLL